MREFIVNLFPGFIVRLFAKPYVSGNSIDKGIAKAKQLWEDRGYSSTLDLLGEEVFTREEVERNVNTYIDLIKKLEPYDFATVSIKPSAMGSHESIEFCEESIRRILEAGKKYKVEITLDMEDHTLTDLTLKIYKKLLVEYPTFGTVLQSRLFRTDKDIADLLSLKTRVRTCIGIYNEDSSIALTDKRKMKEKLVEQSTLLLENGHYVEFATHEVEFLENMLELAEKYNWKSDQLEFQQLLGVPLNKIQSRILGAGFKIRLYVPFSTDWAYAIPYLKRRLINNPKMAIYVLKNLFTRN